MLHLFSLTVVQMFASDTVDEVLTDNCMTSSKIHFLRFPPSKSVEIIRNSHSISGPVSYRLPTTGMFDSAIISPRHYVHMTLYTLFS